jgi:two-component system invasion response regulator UvrY
MQKPVIHIGIVDDHRIFRNGLILILHQFKNFKVVLEASHGLELQEELRKGIVPEIILLDVNMPFMNGYETLDWLKKYFPQIRVIVLTMYEAEQTAFLFLKRELKHFSIK